MSKLEEIVRDYHCYDQHGDCCDICQECEAMLREDLETLIEEVRADAIEQMNILGLVNFKTLQNPIIRKATIKIDYDDRLNAEQVVAIILEQLKEKKE